MSVRPKQVADVGNWKLDEDSSDHKSWSLSGSPYQYVIEREAEPSESGEEEWSSIFYDNSADNADEGELCTIGSLTDELAIAVDAMKDADLEYLDDLAPWTVARDLGDIVEWELPGKEICVVMWKCEEVGHHGQQRGMPVWRHCWELFTRKPLEGEEMEMELVQSGPLHEIWRAAVDLRKRIESKAQSPKKKNAAKKPEKPRTKRTLDEDSADGECLMSTEPPELSGCAADEACICGTAMVRND